MPHPQGLIAFHYKPAPAVRRSGRALENALSESGFSGWADILFIL
jgi:hypothetical protein